MILKKLNKRQQSLPGFSLIEVMIAILIMGISVIVLISLQSRLLRGVFEAHSIFESLGLVSNMFVRADDRELYKKKEPIVKKIEDSQIVLTYTAKKPEDKKKLAGAENIIVEQLKVQDKNLFSNKEDNFVSLRFLSESPKENSEGKP